MIVLRKKEKIVSILNNIIFNFLNAFDRIRTDMHNALTFEVNMSTISSQRLKKKLKSIKNKFFILKYIIKIKK